ncbi:MAG: tol-pal system protein YbgF [Chlorobiaceae bacterium]|nr:tol-pal system protein YbgF [Chlorobiaceae bacterium]NTV26186.1 tol-pal system protein YbgF [Chlorobiaceae bacterium]
MKVSKILFLPCLLLSACASQNDMKYVQGEVTRLKEDSQTIKNQSAGSYSEITQYREEVASLKGSIEELRHNQTNSLKRLDVEDSLMVRKSDDLESRIARLEQYLGISDASKKTGTKTLPATEGAKGEATAATPAQAQKPAIAQTGDDPLKDGLAKMGKADYSGSREAFKSFMTRNPKSPKVADAQFYIAESYFSEKWYEKAILEYQVVIAKYTKSPKRPAALYKQALSFEKINDSANAKARFKDVVTLYPASPEAKLAKKKLQ